MADDPFIAKPGRIRQTGSKPGRRFTKAVMVRVEQAGGSRRANNAAFTGGRTGRGLGARFRHGLKGLDRRRVIVKIRLVTFGKGAARLAMLARARAHLSYLQRESAVNQAFEHAPPNEVGQDQALQSAEGSGRFYDLQNDSIDGMSFLSNSEEDRHQFRIIVSPEHGNELSSLKDYTRDLMRGVESDLDTKLDWIAVDHFNTGHPHTHIVLRGRDDRGQDLIIARDYIRHGFRQRAELNLMRELGPRPVREIAASLKQEMTRDRFTSLDRDLLALATDWDVKTRAARTAYDRFRAGLRLGRLKHLERMGLVQEIGEGNWRLKPDLQETLTRMGERGDIIRTMQRAHGRERERQIFDAADPAQKPITGEIIASGLRDDREGRKYLIVSATDGRHWYADIAIDHPLPRDGGIVTLFPAQSDLKPSDRTIDRIARLNRGVYSSDLHLATDGPQSEGFLTAHKRRLEALRRKNIVTREADGTWRIPQDYLSRIASAERAGVKLDVASWVSTSDLPTASSGVCLDDLLVKDISVSNAGFGKTLRDALARRRQFLLTNGFAKELSGRLVIDTQKLENLTKAAVEKQGARIAKKMSRKYLAFSRQVAGTYLHPVDLPGGRFAVVDQGKTITLVRWSHVLERYRGQPVQAQLRGMTINWTVGRSVPLSPR